MDGPSQEPDKEKTMYEREERLIEEAERLAAAATAGLPPTEKGARDASALSAIQQAITECESANRMISSVYQTLRCRVPADRADVDQGRKELLPRAWTALLLVEREKDFLINDLYRLQSEANRPNKR
jgi:hypothetical protein